jgi:hypothetical protein
MNATHQTILERFKTLPESGLPGHTVDTAHDAELRAGKWVRAYVETRETLAKQLREDWSEEEIQTAGLLPVRNPRCIMKEIENILADRRDFRELKAVLNRLYIELDSTLEPILSQLPEPE